MKQKLTFLILALFTAMGAWATVTMPTLTSDVTNPHYYTIKNYRSTKYATYAGPSTQLSQISEANMYSLWYFVENAGGVSIVPAIDPSVKLASTTSATATGSVWYLVENPHNAGYFCVSLSSGATTNCWDDQGASTKIGYWQPSGSDFEGTSWIIEESATTLAEVIAYRREQILPTINALPEVLRPSAKMTALNNAATDAAFRAAVADFSANVTFTCRSGRFLVVGDAAASHQDAPSANDKIIQLESVGDGSFYIKGYMSMKYLADVEVSTTVQTEAEANIPYYIQTVGDYAVARPTKWADSGWSNGYHYLHNGGGNNNCVGWESGNSNCQYTIESVELPDGLCTVTYNIELDDEVIATEKIRQAVGATSALPSSWARDFTTYAYDVATIPDAATATITATATVSGLPFTVSTDFEHATWYYMRGHVTLANYPNHYISTSGDNLVWADGMSHTDAYRWAFIGNPINGFKVINRAAGSTKFLQATATQTTMGTTQTEWVVKNQPNYDKANESFGLWNSVRTYANCAGGTVKYWGSFDQGSTFWVEAVDPNEFLFENVLAELKAINWSDTDAAGQLNRYNLTGSVVGYAGNEQSLIDGLESSLITSGYDADSYNAAQGMLDNYALNMPAANKFYRIQGNTSSKYLASGLTGGKFSMTNATDASTIFYFDGTKLTNLGSGMCNGMKSNAWAWVTGENASVVTFQDGLTNGGYAIKSAADGMDTNKAHFYDNGDNSSSADRGGSVTINKSTNSRYTNWYLTEITTLPITMKTVDDANYFATINLPTAVTVPSGVSAYEASASGTVLSLTKVVEGGVLAASQPVILYSNSAVASLAISDAAGTPATGDNELAGTIAAESVTPNNNYVLGVNKEGSVVGFYKYGGTEMPGFKAYLPVGATSSVKAFTFSFDDIQDAIRAIESDNNNLEIYDIAGRRVPQAQKGLYIVNGKKVMYK